MSELTKNPLELGENSESGTGEIDSQAGIIKLRVWKTLFPGIFFRIGDAAALVKNLEEQRRCQQKDNLPANLNTTPLTMGNQKLKKTT